MDLQNEHLRVGSDLHLLTWFPPEEIDAQLRALKPRPQRLLSDAAAAKPSLAAFLRRPRTPKVGTLQERDGDRWGVENEVLGMCLISSCWTMLAQIIQLF